MKERGGFDTWLRRCVLVSVLVLAAFTCFFVWRISMVALRIERAIAASSGDVQSVSRSAAEIGQQVAELGRGLDALTDKVQGMSEWIELREGAASLMGDAVLPGASAAEEADPARDEEVAYLLSRIRKSGLEFQHDDDTRSATWTALKLGAAHQVFKGSIPNAEAFIERIAAQQLDGDEYLVRSEDGSTRPLAEWLTEALGTHRQEAQPEPEAGMNVLR